MKAKIGFNVHGDAANLDRNKLKAVVGQLKAPWHLVMNDLTLAKELTTLPGAKIAYRWTPADDSPLTSWPSAYNFVDFALREFEGVPLYAVVSNEAGYDDALLQRTCEIIEYGCPKGLHVAVLGLASGTPANPDDWKRPAMRRLLELCDQYRAYVIVAMDEYFCGVVTSGFIGGAPTFIQPGEWPKNLTDVVQWHSGRYNLLLTACDEMVIRAPRLLIKEHGADDMSDISFWSKTLTITPPYLNIRSWKSLVDQWRIWWPGWDSQRAYFEQLKYANDVIYANPLIEGVLIFAWASPDANWEAFDVSQADDLHRQLIEHANPPIITPAPAPKYAPAKTYRYSGTKVFNIRAEATETSADIGDLKDGDYVTFDDTPPKEADKHLWQRGVVYTSTGTTDNTNEIAGWLAVDLITLTEKPAEPTTPPVIVLTTDQLIALAVAHEAVAAAHDAIALAEIALAEANRAMAKVYRDMTGQAAVAENLAA